MSYGVLGEGWFGVDEALGETTSSFVEESGGILDFLAQHSGDIASGLLTVGSAAYGGYVEYQKIQAQEEQARIQKAALQAQIEKAKADQAAYLASVEAKAAAQRKSAAEESASLGFLAPGQTLGGVSPIALGIGALGVGWLLTRSRR